MRLYDLDYWLAVGDARMDKDKAMIPYQACGSTVRLQAFNGGGRGGSLGVPCRPALGD